jgi:hypothetical protein
MESAYTSSQPQQWLTKLCSTRSLNENTKNALFSTLHHYNSLLIGSLLDYISDLHRLSISEIRARTSSTVLLFYLLHDLRVGCSANFRFGNRVLSATGILMPGGVEASITSAQNIDKYSLISDWRKTLPSPIRRLPTPSSGGSSQHYGTTLKRKRVSTPRSSPRRSQRLKSNRCMDGGERSQWDAEGEAEFGARSEDRPLLLGRRDKTRGEAVRGGRITKRASGSRSPKKRGPLSGLDSERRQQLWENPDFESASTFEPLQSEITTSSRSRSPVKSVVNLRTAKLSTVFISTVPGTQCPEPATQLRRLLTKGTYRNEGVIPRGLEVSSIFLKILQALLTYHSQP